MKVSSSSSLSSSALIVTAILIQAHRSAAFLSLTNNIPIHAISRSLSLSSLPPFVMSASSSLSKQSSSFDNNAATIVSSTSSSSCDYSFASDYALRINAPILVASSQSYDNQQLDDTNAGGSSDHGVCYSSTWEFHPLQQGNGDNLDAAVMQYSTCDKPPSNSITCTWEND
eukprot:scaffold42413_cov23-Cyclotella_meneghiniana.AAC.3